MVARWLTLCDGDPWCEHAVAHFAAAMDHALEEIAPRPGLVAYWRPRLSRIADFVLTTERARGHVTRRHAEVKGRLTLDCGVTIHGRADRVDVLSDDSLAILDLKTGTPPSHAQMADGRAPQLPLEAAMAARGAFDGVPALAVSELAHWHVSGGWHAGEVHVFKPKGGALEEVTEDTLIQVENLVRAFLLSERPFLARPHPSRAPRGDEYDHLSRIREWGGAVAGDGGDA
jgi:ATP-dependent helicase/nuclease subunit B